MIAIEVELVKYHHEVQYYVHPSIITSFTKGMECFQNEEPDYGELVLER